MLGNRRAKAVLFASILLIVILVGAWGIIGHFGLFSHNTIAGDPVLKADARSLKSTVISSHLDEPVEPGGNVLWCSTFQLVWNDGCKAAKGDIHLQDEPAMVAALNKKAASVADVDPASCLVLSGLVQDGISGQIRQALQDKFHGQADPDLLNRLEGSLPPEGWLAYAYLFRELPFAYPFKRFKEPLKFAGDASVASFGIRPVTSRADDMRRAGQVTVVDYRTDDDFIIELRLRDPNERIVLAKTAPAATLQTTIEAVRARRHVEKERHDADLMPQESVVVPVLNFDLLREYDELYRKPILPPAGTLEGMPIVLAFQSIRFRLDERGAVLKSEAGGAVATACTTTMAPRQPRQLIFDKPFLILLERSTAAQPYFALWIGNAELLVRAGNQ